MGLYRATALWKEPSGALLYEHDQEYQHQNLGKDGTGPRFHHLVRDTQSHAADECAPEIANTTEDDDHETIDDVSLSEVGADIGQL